MTTAGAGHDAPAGSLELVAARPAYASPGEAAAHRAEDRPAHLSTVVQAVVRRSTIIRRLGDDRP
jgi:hypothetical protein